MGYQPTGKRYDQWTIGEKYYSPARTVTEADIATFAGLAGDYNPLHTDEEFAKTTVHGGRIAHGALTFSISTGLVNRIGIGDGTIVGFLGASMKFTAPVHPGDTITAILTPTEKRLTKDGKRGIIVSEIQVVNQAQTVVCQEEWTVMVLV